MSYTIVILHYFLEYDAKYSEIYDRLKQSILQKFLVIIIIYAVIMLWLCYKFLYFLFLHNIHYTALIMGN
jgi:hypothetical protein